MQSVLKELSVTGGDVSHLVVREIVYGPAKQICRKQLEVRCQREGKSARDDTGHLLDVVIVRIVLPQEHPRIIEKGVLSLDRRSLTLPPSSGAVVRSRDEGRGSV